MAVKFNPQSGYDSTISGIPNAATNFWYKIGTHKLSFAAASKIPNSMLIVTLVSNFGTFLLYMMTCIVAIVAFREHHILQYLQAHGRADVRAAGQPRLCMVFYLVGPFTVAGMSKVEPFIAARALRPSGASMDAYLLQQPKQEDRQVGSDSGSANSRRPCMIAGSTRTVGFV